MHIPDKKRHKPTITEQLRKDIISLAKKENYSSYLEIGFDRGYTMLSLKNANVFDRIAGLDISKQRYSEAQKLLGEDAEIYLNDVSCLPQINCEFDIVFIDANHSYKMVKNDTIQTLKNNKKENYIIIFHDYGLVNSGVKSFVHDTFKEFKTIGERDDWNPLGGKTNDWEAVYVNINDKIKAQILAKI